MEPKMLPGGHVHEVWHLDDPAWDGNGLFTSPEGARAWAEHHYTLENCGWEDGEGSEEVPVIGEFTWNVNGELLLDGEVTGVFIARRQILMLDER